jgi:CRISPR/Cas system-associated exonuclease Cas4 (RecB family)
VKIGYYDLISPSPKFIEYEVTQEDVDALKYWCNSLYEEKVFPSRRGAITYCKTCPFDKPCSKWVNWFNKKVDKNEK